MLSNMSETLSSFPLFKDLEPATLEILEQVAKPFRYAPGEVIFQQGDVAEYLYLLSRGRVKVHYKPYDGINPIVTYVNAGEVFGWSAVIGNKVYSSGAVCMEPSEGWRIHGNALRLLCKENPQGAEQILDRLATIVSPRWQDAHEQVRSMLSEGMSEGRR